MAEGDVDYLASNNTDCQIEINGKAERGVVSVNPQFAKTLSGSKTGIITTTFEDDERVKGHNRVYEMSLSLSTGLNYFLFDSSSVVDRAVFSLPISISAPEGPVSFELFEGGNYSGGVSLATFNPNRLTDFTHQAVLTGGASGSDEGTSLVSQSFGAAGGFFSSAQPGEGGSSQPSIHDPSKNWLFVINNQTGGALDVNGFFSWFELPNEE